MPEQTTAPAERDAIEAGGAAIKAAIEVLRGCAARGAGLSPATPEFFDGYMKACDDIRRLVIDADLNGRPLPAQWRPNNERPE